MEQTYALQAIFVSLGMQIHVMAFFPLKTVSALSEVSNSGSCVVIRSRTPS